MSQTYWFGSKPRLASITPGRPGLFELLIKRTLHVSPFSMLLHLGMVVALLTAVLMEIMYFTGLASILRGWGWVVTWAHGIFGLVLIVGFAGVIVRFAGSQSFRLAAGRMAYVDAAFIAVISLSGLVLLLQVLGVVASRATWLTVLHAVSAMSWLIVSLFADGLVAHAVSTIVYRFTAPRSQAAYNAFSSACGRCGKCVEVCPMYEASNGKPEEAPALKVRRYLRAFNKESSLAERRRMAEELYVCSLCGLCMAVCPYSFRHYDLYTSLLARVKGSGEGVKTP